MISGTSHFSYVLDALGSVVRLTDGSGNDAAAYTYDPYGKSLTATGTQATTNAFRFASGYFDSATGLTKFGTRYYDPVLGRWTQRDSVACSIGSPNSLDRYAYAADNPINLTDRSGRMTVGECIGAVLALEPLLSAAELFGLAAALLSGEVLPGVGALLGLAAIAAPGPVEIVAAVFFVGAELFSLGFAIWLVTTACT
jgi:RHS repeat-associated protein